MNKYHARKTKIDGITFDSLAEARRYSELLLLQQAGEISNLEVHPRYEIMPAFEFCGEKVHKTEYEADFTYTERRRLIIEDVKGGKATQTRLFQLKLKMLKYKLRFDGDVEIRIVER